MVTDSRRYLSWPGNNPKLPVSAFVSPDSGILSAKRAINELHRRLGEEGYSQVRLFACVGTRLTLRLQEEIRMISVVATMT